MTTQLQFIIIIIIIIIIITMSVSRNCPQTLGPKAAISHYETVYGVRDAIQYVTVWCKLGCILDQYG